VPSDVVDLTVYPVPLPIPIESFSSFIPRTSPFSNPLT